MVIETPLNRMVAHGPHLRLERTKEHPSHEHNQDPRAQPQKGDDGIDDYRAVEILQYDPPAISRDANLAKQKSLSDAL